eukprot:GAHX01000961.1.p1 GENE.GAHX01000961.1~~GAHX01000961.1.p1  ORF type:complete len:706 (-),score=142.27 GAHX01000961.1:1339-3456(-)
MRTLVSNRIHSHSTRSPVNILLDPITKYADSYGKGELYTLSKEELQASHEACYLIINFKDRGEFLILYDTLKSELTKINNTFLTSWLRNVSVIDCHLNTKQTFIEVIKFTKIQNLVFSYLNKHAMRFFSEDPLTTQLNNQFLLLFKQNSVTLRNLIFNSIESFDFDEIQKLRLVLLNLKLSSSLIIDDFFELTGKTIQRKIIQIIKKRTVDSDPVLQHEHFKEVLKYLDIFSVFVKMDDVMEVLVQAVVVDIQSLGFQKLKELIENSEKNQELLNRSKIRLSNNFKSSAIQTSALEAYFPHFFHVNKMLLGKFDKMIDEAKEVIKKHYIKRCIEVSKEKKLESFADFIDLSNTVNSYYEEIKDIVEDIKTADPVSLRVFACKGLLFSKCVTMELVGTLKTNNQSLILQKISQILKTYQYFITLKDFIECFAISVILNIYINGRMINNNIQSLLFGIFEKESKKERNYLKLVFNSFKNFKRVDKTDKLITTEVEFVLMKKLHSVFKFQQSISLSSLVENDEKSPKDSPLNNKCDVLGPFIILETGSMVMLNIHYNILKKIHCKKLQPNPLGLELSQIEKLALDQLIKAKIVEFKEDSFTIHNITEKSGKLVLELLIEYIYREQTGSKEDSTNNTSGLKDTLLLEKARFFIEEIFDTEDKEWTIDNINRLIQTKFKINQGETDGIIEHLNKEEFFKIDKETGVVELL